MSGTQAITHFNRSTGSVSQARSSLLHIPGARLSGTPKTGATSSRCPALHLAVTVPGHYQRLNRAVSIMTLRIVSSLGTLTNSHLALVSAIFSEPRLNRALRFRLGTERFLEDPERYASSALQCDQHGWQLHVCHGPFSQPRPFTYGRLFDNTFFEVIFTTVSVSLSLPLFQNHAWL